MKDEVHSVEVCDGKVSVSWRWCSIDNLGKNIWKNTWSGGRIKQALLTYQKLKIGTLILTEIEIM